MSGRLWFVATVLLGLVVMAACAPTPAATSIAPNLPNPASVFCEKNGGKLEIRNAKDGGQFGVCVFADKSECDEWAFFRGECKPGDSLKPAVIPTLAGGWLVYRNAARGYSFHYPPQVKIETALTVEDTLTLSGPLVGGEHWPVITFNHPRQRAEYAPPPEANLEKWLKDNNLLAGERLADTRIAGTGAIHLRQKSGGQAYNADLFFFARGGQLYSVVFLHTGGKEDWALYNRFLESVAFEK